MRHMLSLRDFLLVLFAFVFLCVVILAHGEYHKYLRDRLDAESAQNPSKRRKAARRRTRIGVYVTVGWLILFSAISFSSGPLDEPNKWGDWAAGAFAPVAFGWLVLGYFQQGEELRDNVKALNLQERALHLQVYELRESVKQQTALAEASAKQAAGSAETNSLPLRAQLLPHQPLPASFRLVRNGPSGELVLMIKNKGAPVTDVRATLHVIDSPESQPELVGDWPRTGNITISEDLRRHHFPFSASLQLQYTDELLFEQSQRFYLTIYKDEDGENKVAASRTSITIGLPG